MRHTLPKQLTICELILRAQERLALGLHPERARLDAETLLLHILQQRSPQHSPQHNRAWLISNWNYSLYSGIQKLFSELVARRVAGEPIQYILGETEFYGLPFRVTRDVLIPRSETEHLVEKVLELAANFAAPQIVDVGAGSGAIAVTLAHKLPQAQITAIDLSATALKIARENAKHNGVSIRFLQGDLLAPVAGERFEFVVSNPPYVPASDRATLAVEVREYEPALALFAGDDGLDVYRRLIPAVFNALIPGGFLVLEIGYGQSTAITELLTDCGFEQIEFVPDLQGIPRVACAQRPS